LAAPSRQASTARGTSRRASCPHVRDSRALRNHPNGVIHEPACRWMACVDSITPSGSNAIRLNAANSGVPSPSSRGAAWTWSSWTRHAFSACWMTLAPPMMWTFLSPAAAFARRRRWSSSTRRTSSQPSTCCASPQRRRESRSRGAAPCRRGHVRGPDRRLLRPDLRRLCRPVRRSLAAHVASYTALSWCSRSG
jgi:hypothetical protein